jgi:hypothetical protein
VNAALQYEPEYRDEVIRGIFKKINVSAYDPSSSAKCGETE